MKKKLIILTLCFSIILSSINLKKSYANPLALVTPQMVGVIATIGVGCGLTFTDNSQIYNFVRFIKDRNEETWNLLKLAYKTSVALLPSGKVEVKSDFIKNVTSTVDDYISSLTSGSLSSNIVKNTQFSEEVPLGGHFITIEEGETIVDDFTIKVVPKTTSTSRSVAIYYKDNHLNSILVPATDTTLRIFINNNAVYRSFYRTSKGWLTPVQILSDITVYDLPENFYDFDSTIINDKLNDTISVPLNIPSDLSDLLNKDTSHVFSDNPGYVLPSDGIVSIPGVSNPSISIGDSVPYPGTGTDTDVGTGTDTDVGTGTDTDVGTGDITFPSFGDSIDFSPLEATGITEKFPFSLPWDIGRLLSIFDVSPVAPKFEFPILGQKIVIDFTDFEEWANITRFFVQISFICVLIFISTRLKG